MRPMCDNSCKKIIESISRVYRFDTVKKQIHRHHLDLDVIMGTWSNNEFSKDKIGSILFV